MRIFYTNKFWYALVLFVMLSGIAFVFHNNSLKNFPKYMHAWSQSDHFALVLGFLNNDLDLLHPETYNLMPNLQNPTELETSITAVDFPLIEYVSAVIMKSFGLTTPLTYRILTILSSVFALIFIYLISWRMRVPALVGFLLAMTLACSPIFIYYQAAILPTMSAFMLACGAIYFYIFFLERNNITLLLLAIVHITLATGIRKTYFIFFAALLLHHVYLILTKRKRTKSLMFWAIGIISLLAFNAYQYYLHSHYGSAFLGSLMPPGSLSEFIDLTKVISSKWTNHLYNKAVNILLIAIAVLFFLKIYSHKLKRLQTNIAELILIFFLAAFAFYIALQKQFVNHDYYFLDIFFLPSALLIILFLSHLNLNTAWKENIIVLLFCVVFFWSISDARSMHAQRQQVYPPAPFETERINFTGSEAFLNQIGVPKDAKMLCLSAVTTNTPLILMNRKGYTVHKWYKSYIEQSLLWPHNYVVVQNQFILSHINKIYPKFLKRYSRIGSNGKISIFSVAENDSLSTIQTLCIDTIQSLHADTSGTFFKIENKWETVLTNDSAFYKSKPYSLKINSENLYPCGFEILLKNKLNDNSFVELIWQSDLNFSDLSKKTFLIVQSKYKSQPSVTKQYELTELVTSTNEWQNINILVPVDLRNELESVQVFIHNPNKNTFWADDLNATIYTPNF